MRPMAATPHDDIVRVGIRSFPAFSLSVVARTPSTQDIVKAAAVREVAEGFCCVAHEQTAGRGRQGRRWTAPPDTALLVSILLRPRTARISQVPIAAGLAVVDAIDNVSGIRPQVKWPNDILINGAKLAGILAEAVPMRDGSTAVVLGIGINLDVPTFPEGLRAVSLHTVTSAVVTWESALCSLLPALATRMETLETSGIAGIQNDWRAAATGLGGTVTVRGAQDITGTAVDIDDDGALVVETSEGTVRCLAGDVHIGLTES